MSVDGYPAAVSPPAGVFTALGPYRLRAAMLSRTESRRMGAAAPRDISDLAINGPVPALLLLDPRRAVQPRTSTPGSAPPAVNDDERSGADPSASVASSAVASGAVASSAVADDAAELANSDTDATAEDAVDEPAPLLAWLHRAERTPRAELGDPRPHAARTAQLILEVLAGQRPATALRGVAHPDVIQRLAVAAQGFTHQQADRRRLAIRPTVGRVIVSEPRDGIAEATVIIREGRRCRALALRLEGLQGHWTATLAELG